MPPFERDSNRIVIAGASSLLGAELKSLLEESRFAGWDLRLVDEEVTAGTLTEAGGEVAVIQPVEEGTFERARLVFFTGWDCITSPRYFFSPFQNPAVEESRSWRARLDNCSCSRAWEKLFLTRRLHSISWIALGRRPRRSWRKFESAFEWKREFCSMERTLFRRFRSCTLRCFTELRLPPRRPLNLLQLD